jgi:hypothetical protein
MALENRLLRIIFGREEVTAYWRQLHNEELHNSYTSLKKYYYYAYSINLVKKR